MLQRVPLPREERLPPRISPKVLPSIIALIGEGRSSRDIASEMGYSVQQIAAVKAHMTMGTYPSGEIRSAAEAEAEAEQAIDAKFGLERDLQTALRRNLAQLESGLTIADGSKEHIVPSGRIDITARDHEGTTVVIELKAGEADRDAVAQVLSYMGDLMDRQRRVRGVLVAHSFTNRAEAAARSVSNLRLVRYGFQFTFQAVAGKAT